MIEFDIILNDLVFVFSSKKKVILLHKGAD